MLDRRLLISTGILVTLIIGLWWQWPDKRLHVVQCDVGQGDAELVFLGFDQVLVDGGPPNSKVLNCLSNHMPFWDKKIELMVATHMDVDHIGSLSEVVERYQVGMVVVGDDKEETELAREFLEKTRSLGLLHEVRQGQELKLADMVWKVVWPDGGSYDSNEGSVVLRLDYGGFTVLFTGDMTTDVENKLIGQKFLEGIEILKVAHHGSKTSSSEEFLKLLSPDLALMGVGKGNRYNLPNDEVLNRFKALQIPVLRTDEIGEIEVVSDGKGYNVLE